MSYVDVRDFEVGSVSERELTGLMKAWRGGRATRNLAEALSEGYIMVLSVVMLGAMFVNLLLGSQREAAACTTAACTSSRALLPIGLAAGVIAAAAFIARLAGPVVASAAEGSWLLDAPIRRSRILAGRLVRILVTAFVIGAVLGALLALLTGSPWITILAWAAATGLGAASMVAFSATQQGRDSTVAVRVLQVLFTLLAVAALGMVVAVAAGWVSVSLLDRSQLMALAIAAVSAVVLLGCAILAFGRLDRMRRARLQSGGSLVSGMQGAMFALDMGLMRDILVERECIERGSVRPARGKGIGPSALIWRDAQRLLRKPAPLFGLILSAVVPYAVAALGLGKLVPLVSAWVLCFILVPFFQQLRVLSRTKGLIRMFPHDTASIRTACMAIPAVLALVWAGLVTPSYLGMVTGERRDVLRAVLMALITAAAGLLGAVRWVAARPPNFNTPMFASSMGAIPPGLIGNLLRGTDMVVLITAPLVFGWSPWISLALAFIVFAMLRSTSSMEELQEQADEAKKENERLKEEARLRRENVRLNRR